MKHRTALTTMLTAAAMGVLFLAGGSPATATPSTGTIAPAVVGNGICETGEFCLYRDANRTGPVKDYASGIDDNTYVGNTWPIVGGKVNDGASSVWNRTGCKVRVYQHADQNGSGKTIDAGGWTNLSGTPVGNDEASSHDACV
ncbi:MAG TPA: peptidase inhibitor family I36 protein [Pilimelia sp.]|nr:peptidase inhibitor family I36 protein [Pilimelia sp.]